MTRIKTNNVPRFTIDAHTLTQKEREQFDYLDWEAIDKGEASPLFFRFKGEPFDVGEFMRIIPAGGELDHMGMCHHDIDGTFKGWHGSMPTSYFHGYLIRLVDDGDRVVVGQYFD